MDCINATVIGVSINKPHTSRRNGMSVAFTKIYMGIQITGTSVMYSQKYALKNQVKSMITYKCFRMCLHHEKNYKRSLLTLHNKAGACIHHTRNYLSSVLMLHIRLVRMFIT